MEPLLFLAHRIPYPPNKGDKIRSFNLLRYLGTRYRVYLGCFVDSADDIEHVEPLRRYCADLHTVRLAPRLARLKSIAGLATGEALTLPYFRSASLGRWVDETIARQGISKALVFSSPMAQYLRRHPQVRAVVDLVDVDSAKWAAYAEERSWPLSFILRREATRLLAFERSAVSRAAAGVLVTPAEVELFDRLAPECSLRMHAIENGVDSDYFSPSKRFASPFREDETPIVFTGVMDYWPNVDAVTWFVREVLPAVASKRPDVRFHVVGMNPAPSLLALAADPRVVVSGKVPDVRPYLQHARVVVAPLRVARGVQNKVLEAMSMARPTVVSSVAAAAIAANPGTEIEVAADAREFAERTLSVLTRGEGDPMGMRARARILESYQWESALARFLELLDRPAVEPTPIGGRADLSAAALVS